MRIIDLRSDTVTQPTLEMREAMAKADVGDDVYGDDPTVNRLEALAADILQKDAALFVPSGTFGNQVALLTHCNRGDEVILGEDCHIIQHETGAAGIISGVQLRTVPSSLNRIPGWILPEEIEARIRKAENIHYPKTTLICLENAHSSGCVLPLEYMESVQEIAKFYKIPIHLDGARIFNAAEYLGLSPDRLAATADSIMFCLSKGLAAPAGSILAGSKLFIEKARKNRKLMGGAMRQSGILAAAGIISLTNMRERLKDDHKNARLLGKWLNRIEGIVVSTKRIHTNIVFCSIDFKPPLNPNVFVERMKQSGILINPPEETMRFVTHKDIRETDIRRTVEVIDDILSKDFW
ncbi:MAG: beta-eliminating lyase-related protein [Turicibacter sp.]|nr:beta-eliminating lyase-related protein [Turicibacter sp.]